MHWLHKILALAIICAAVEGQVCPSACKCTTTRLVCTSSTAPGGNLTSNQLNYSPGLQDVSWTDSNIKYIKIGAFDGLQNLEYIDLSRNEIKRTETALFSKLTRLKHLNISRNRLDDIRRLSFINLDNLEVLDVSHNELQVIPFQVFAPLSRLQYLDISYNRIATFLDFYFNPNRQLKSLFLNNNSLVKITSNALVNLKELETLDISSNKLDYIPKNMFDNFDQLRKLNISYNNFQNISSDAFKNLKNLRWLNMGGNRLRLLPPSLFTNNENIEDLRLEHTEITVIQNTNFKGLNNLEKLYIRNNGYLREIEPFVFQDTLTITHLDISANVLTFLPLSLKALEKLEELRISNNPWACDCRMAWFANWVDQRQHIIKSDLSCGPLSYPNDMVPILRHTNCEPPVLITSSPLALYRLQSDALLECQFSGNPAPSITWITPTSNVFHWNPDSLIPDIFHKHGVAHDQYYRPIDNTKSRVRVLENGALFISDIHREDCGTYLCFATNPSANVTAEVILNIDPMTMFEIKIYSLICGAFCAAAFLGITLLVQFIRYIFHRLVLFQPSYLGIKM
jgi:Leucine-rich repeat (LRR) protein